MNKDLEVALKAARKGAAVINSFQKEEIDIEYKGRHDLVTKADLQTEKEILDVINRHFPDDYVMAEESAGEQRDLDGRVWIVDPIDGTTNFAYRFPVYCVSVALWEDGRPLTGVVLEVNRGEEFTAVNGEGAWLNGKPIRVSAITEPDKSLIGTGFPYNDYSLLEDYFQLFRSLIGQVQGIRRPGAATYDLCCVAAGRFQGFYEYALKAWDVGAASLIIREAGGIVSDWIGGDDWLFGERIVAGNESIHRYLLKKIEENVSLDNRTL